MTFQTVAAVEFSQTAYMFTENEPLSQICIVITNDVTVEANLELTLQSEDSSAGSSDFQSINEVVVIANTTTCITVQGIAGDGLVETPEMFRVSIQSGNPRLVISPTNEIVVIIMDSDSKLSCK